jgi:hypothetical protein
LLTTKAGAANPDACTTAPLCELLQRIWHPGPTWFIEFAPVAEKLVRAALTDVTPKTTARVCRNAERDAWVARQRNRKTPPPWDEIYDEGVRLSARRGWDMPGTWKSLEEAHRRYLKRLRETAAKPR